MFSAINDGFGTLTIEWENIDAGTQVAGTVNLPEPYIDLKLFLHRNTDMPEFMVISSKPLPDDVNVAFQVVNDALGTITELTITDKNQTKCRYPGFVYTGIYVGPQASLLTGQDVHYRVKIGCVYTRRYNFNSSSNLSLAFDAELCADFKLLIGNQVIKVNKLILMANSDVFKTMIESNLTEANENEVVIMDVEYEPMHAMIKAMYSGQVGLDGNVELALKVLTAADKYNVHGIVKACEQLILDNVTESNILSILIQVNKLEDGVLLVGCLEYLNKLEKPKLIAIKQSEEWNQLKANYLVYSLIEHYARL